MYRGADRHFKENNQSEERKGIYDAWLGLETTYGDEDSQSDLRKKAPKRVKKKRQLLSNEGGGMEWEEYWDYVFPDGVTMAPNLKLLQMAKKWKKANEAIITKETEPRDDVTDTLETNPSERTDDVTRTSDPNRIPIDDSDSDIEM